jgi:hypothetical protein
MISGDEIEQVFKAAPTKREIARALILGGIYNIVLWVLAGFGVYHIWGLL